jgi:predicted nucleic acid-binding protein
MTAPVFVDTNVIVYARDASEHTKQPRAAAWLEYLWRTQSGRTSVQVLSEYYVTVTRESGVGLPATEAWDDVKALSAWQPAAIDMSLLARTQEIAMRWQISWWDAQIVAAAEAQGCSLLLSEDFQDGGVYAGVTVRSPFTLDVNEPRAAYSVAASVSRHPPRGRPKRAPATAATG